MPELKAEGLSEDKKQELIKYNQTHLVEFLSELPEAEAKKLRADIENIDLAECADMFHRATNPERSQSSLDERMRTIGAESCASVTDSTPEQLSKYRASGLEAISKGQVGLLLLAGGQGTRLGVNYPKGMFVICPSSKKSLYQIQVERLLRLEELAFQATGRHGSITMYIMTSEHTKGPTQDFFSKNGYFGMKKENLVLFEQRMIPCFDFEGKIILETKSRVARAPDGNGGLYWAMKHERILENIESRGVEFLHAYCVDNILVKVADPVFMGYCIGNGADCANKVLEKAFPSEAVGVVCKVDDVIQVVEYSEISKETSELRNPDGKLKYSAGNICNHFFTAAFLRRVCDGLHNQMTLHVAKKKIPKLGTKPDAPNGIKLEKFVFDVFQFSEHFLVWECLREDEFSPLKNSDGPGKKDTPKTAREALFALHKTYVEKAGGKLLKGDGDEGDVPTVEISALLSYAGEGLEELVGGKTFTTPVVFKAESEKHESNGNGCQI